MRTDDGDAPALRFAVCPMANRSGLSLPQYFASRHEATDWVQSTGGRGWIEEPLEVVSLQSCVGSIFQGKRVLEWLPRDQIAAPQVLTSEAVTARLVEVGLQEIGGETAWPACCLDVDWRFAEIEREARTLPGHNYVWKKHSSLRDVVWNMLGDFDAVMATRHPNATISALAHFCRSWQLYEHVMRFCAEKLADSVAAGAFPFGWENSSEAGQFALRQLCSYASAISMAPDETNGEPAAKVPEEVVESIPNSGSQGRRRGPKPDYDTPARVAEIVRRVAPDGDWRSKIDDVVLALDHGVCHASDPETCDEDHEKIPLPRGWSNWANPPDHDTMVKAIEYRLKVAMQRKKATPEILS